MIEYFIGMIIMTGLCALLANHNGRNVSLACLLGFFFGFFALIGYLIAGKTEDKKIENFRDMQYKMQAKDFENSLKNKDK